jgi:hypothetical protein
MLIEEAYIIDYVLSTKIFINSKKHAKCCHYIFHRPTRFKELVSIYKGVSGIGQVHFRGSTGVIKTVSF